MDILERIHKLYPALTKKQKAIADYLTSNPEEISYITLSQLSHQTNVSELTLLRFCQKVGCENFLELKEQFRDYTQRMIRLTSSPFYFTPVMVSGESSERDFLLQEIRNTEISAFSDFFSTASLTPIIEASDIIRKSRRIFIFAHDISKILGAFLESRLRILYFNAILIDLSDLDETQKTLRQLTEGDLAIFFSFPKYYFPMSNIVKRAAETQIPILAITDSESSPAARHTDHLLICPSATRIFYNSLALPMAMLNLLVSCLVIDNVAPSERQDFIDTLFS